MAEVLFSNKKLNPNDQDYLDNLKKNIFLSLNCHAIAKVVKVNKENQTIDAEILYKKTLFRRAENENYVPRMEPYPLLLDCPFVCLYGGNTGLSITPKVGDECIILFNDRSIDEWWSSGQSAPLSTNRLHSLSDGIAIVGVRSSPKALKNFGDDPTLFNDKTIIKVSKKVTIQNESKNLNTVLQDLISKLEALSTQISAITVTCAAPGNPSSPPINKPAIDAIKTQITQIGTDLGGLLE